MLLPSYQEYYLYVLKFGDEARTSDEYLVLICEEMGISAEHQQVRNSSGEPTIRNRLRWAIHYLRHAKLLEKPSRGKFIITERGKKVRSQYELDITNETLKQFQEFQNFISPNTTPSDSNNAGIEELTPIENIEELVSIAAQEIKNELRNQIHEASPYFFEKMVVDLLQNMGYGNFLGTSVTSKSADGGVDGIVYQDILGLEIVYVQAKRNSESNTIGRPDLQKFIGSLSGRKATKGVFFTMSSFTKDALDYLNSVQQKIICIDGDRLLDLMLEYQIGVALRTTYNTYKMDDDYFAE